MPDICLNGAAPNCNAIPADDTTKASGCTIILLGDVLSAHNLVGDGDLLDWVKDSGFHIPLDGTRDWNVNNSVGWVGDSWTCWGKCTDRVAAAAGCLLYTGSKAVTLGQVRVKLQ